MSAALVHARPVGTDAWRNWRGFAEGSAERENFDDELQSDVLSSGEQTRSAPIGCRPLSEILTRLGRP